MISVGVDLRSHAKSYILVSDNISCYWHNDFSHIALLLRMELVDSGDWRTVVSLGSSCTHAGDELHTTEMNASVGLQVQQHKSSHADCQCSPQAGQLSFNMQIKHTPTPAVGRSLRTL